MTSPDNRTAKSQSPHPHHRLAVLDGLRALSILLVLATHMLPLGPKLLRLNETTGPMGMSLFFVLSGFLITTTLMRNADLNEFVIRRLTRIIPLAYAYTLFVFTMISFDPDNIFWTFSFIVNYFPDHLNSYNAHLWSLCVELHFYFAIALVVLIGGQRAIWIVWPACLAITAWRVHTGAYIEIETHLRVDEILAGACVATLYQTLSKYRPALPTSMVVSASLLWFICSSPYSEWCQYFRPYAAALLLSSALCLGDTRLTRLLKSPFMGYISTISYALYVIHPVTTAGWWNQGSPIERYLIKRPVSFLITFLAAHFSTFYWERFWLKLGSDWIQRKRDNVLVVNQRSSS